jgi:hypothetical protein
MLPDGWIAGGLVLLLTTASCSAPDLPDDRRWQSPHFAYHARSADTQVCDGILRPLEEHFTTLSAYLGFSLPQGERVSYYKFVDGEDFRRSAQCPAHAEACSPGRSVLSSAGFDAHELIHAYLARWSPPRVLSEGVAVALSCQLHWTARPRISWRQAATFDPGADIAALYDASGWFVAHLLRTRGPRLFRHLYQTVGRGAGPEELAAAFRSVYGGEVEEAWAAAFGPGARGGCVPVWTCSRPRIAADASPVTLEKTCGAPGDAAFVVSADTVVDWSVRGSSMLTTSCDDGPPIPFALLGGHPHAAANIFPMPAGSYGLLEYMSGRHRFGLESHAGPIEVTGTPVDESFMGAECQPLASRRVDTRSHYIDVPGGDAPYFSRLTFEPGRYTLRLEAANRPRAQAWLCRACDDPVDSCRPITVDGIAANLEGDYVVTFGRRLSTDGYITLQIRR